MTIHGTLYGYCSRGCRCTPCRRAKRQWERRYRASDPSNCADDGHLDHPWLLVDFPVALVARRAFTDDEAIAAMEAS